MYSARRFGNMSSFRKRNVQKPIPGTRTSPQTGQVITSSGNPSLDVILGGGLPIGSICLIEEDKYVTHSKVLAKYFLAEGILSHQSVFLGSLDDDPAELLHKLPKPINDEELEPEPIEDADANEAPANGLRIAWRYNDLPMVNSEQTTTKIGHHFNLLEQMDPLLLDYAETAIWNDTTQSAVEEDDDDDEDSEERDQFSNEDEGNKDVDMENPNKTTGSSADGVGDTTSMEAMDLDVQKSSESLKSASLPAAPAKLKLFENAKYTRILKEIHALLREDKFTTGLLGGQKGLCRICITSLGSPVWYEEQFGKDILKFLTVLRAAVRGSVAVCFITMPMHLMAKFDESLVAKIRNLVDYAIELESFAGSTRETNPAFKEYSGLLHLHKITAINTLSAYMPETCDLAFKLRRKKFVIEKLHLPPELQEDNNKDTPTADIVPTLSCSSSVSPNAKTSLDF